MKAQDFLQEKLPNGDFGDLIIENGDFVIGESDLQHIADIIMSGKGWFKQFPLLGVDPQNDLNGRNLDALRQKIVTNLQSDGYVLKPEIITFINSLFSYKQDATRS